MIFGGVCGHVEAAAVVMDEEDGAIRILDERQFEGAGFGMLHSVGENFAGHPIEHRRAVSVEITVGGDVQFDLDAALKQRGGQPGERGRQPKFGQIGRVELGGHGAQRAHVLLQDGLGLREERPILVGGVPFFGFEGVGQPGQVLNDLVVQITRNALAFQVGGVDRVLQQAAFG